jgi:(2Fe-2S) ferredoxin
VTTSADQPPAPRPRTLLICVNRRFKSSEPSCAARGSLPIADAIENGIRERRIAIAVERIVCLGQCTKGPTLKLVPGEFILGTTLEVVPEILDRLQAACGIAADDGPPAHLLGS